MPSVKLIQNDEANPIVQEIFETLEQERGAVPVTFRAMAHFPDYFKATLARLKTVMTPGKLDARTKIFIALATSINNGSDQCIAAHTKQLRKLGVTDEELLEAIAVIDASTGMNRVNTGLRIFPEE